MKCPGAPRCTCNAVVVDWSRNEYRALLVRVSVALRTGLGVVETLDEVENEIERVQRLGAYTPLDGD